MYNMINIGHLKSLDCSIQVTTLSRRHVYLSVETGINKHNN